MRFEGNNAMRTVKVNRLEILDIVRANRDKHIQEYKETVDNYLISCVEKAKDILKVAKSEDFEQVKNLNWNLPVPRSYEKEYDRAIRMIELSVDDSIELPSETFNQLVLDEWHWKESFSLTASTYAKLK